MIGQKPAQTLSRPLCSQVTVGPARQLLARASISGGSDFGEDNLFCTSSAPPVYISNNCS